MDRNEVLETFQAISKIQNFEECIQILESVDWNLTKALDNVEGTSNHPNIECPTIPSETSDSFETSNELTLIINYMGKDNIMKIDKFKNIGDLKQLITQRLNLNDFILDMNLYNKLYEDDTELSELDIPHLHNVTITKVEIESDKGTTSLSTNANKKQTYALKIQVYKNGEYLQDLQMNYEGKDSIRKVKNDTQRIFGNDKFKYKWSGIPSNVVGSEISLDDSGLNKQCELKVEISDLNHTTNEVSAIPETSNRFMEASVNNSDQNEVDDEDDDYYDESNDMEVVEESTSRVNNTIPSLMDINAYKNQLTATFNFNNDFILRYFNEKFVGHLATSTNFTNDLESRPRPPFYVGTLEDAMQDTLNKHPSDRKPLFVYIHNGESIQANIFCTQILCYSDICMYFNQMNYQIWPWDITYTDNRKHFYAWFARSFSTNLVSTLKIIPKDEFPVLIAIGKSQGNYEILDIFDNKRTKEQTLQGLIDLQSKFMDSQLPDLIAWEERQQRELVKQEQDEAYQQALIADRAKEQKKDEEEKRKREEEEKRQKEELRKENEKVNQIENAKSMLPDEPSSKEKEENIVTIRLRPPSDSDIKDQKLLTRKFLYTHKLRHLIAFMESLGFPQSEYKLLVAYPRKDLTQIKDKNMTLKDLGLPRRDTLTIESI